MTPSGGFGERAATLVAVADPGESATVSLTGEALLPAALRVDPVAHDFADTSTGSTSLAVLITLRNDGTENSGTVTQVLGGDAGDFTITNNSCGGLLLGTAACNLHAQFAPSTGGPKSATITFTAEPGGEQVVTLTGFAIGSPALSIAPSSHDYQKVPLGGQSAPVQFVVTNSGFQPLATPVPALGGDAAGDFEIVVNNCPVPLAIGDECSVDVRMVPTVVGARFATLTVTADSVSTSATLVGNEGT
jgi:hypothetical protein